MTTNIREFKPLERSEVLALFTPEELEQLQSFERALEDARRAMAERRARMAKEYK